MTSLGYADLHAPVPALVPIGVPDRPDDRARMVNRVRTAAAVPAALCLSVHLLFLVAYWIPETSAFPAHDWWLAQLSPFVAESVTSAGSPQVAAQADQAGVGGELLLLASVALLVLVRNPRLLGHGAGILPAAFGSAVAVVILLALLVGGRPGASGLALLLLVVWVWTAGYAALCSLLVDVEVQRARRWRDGVPWLAAYAVLAPLPTAVGRALFGAELRDSADLLRENTVALRLAGLTNGGNVLLYVSGVLLGVVVWAIYQCWPPRRDAATALRVLVAVVALLTTAAVGGVATGEARQRADQIRYDSPAAAGDFGCGTAQLGPARTGGTRRPVRTLAITGLSCSTLTTFEGYRQLTTRTVPFSLAVAAAQRPDGGRIKGRVVSAQYGDVLVLVGTERLRTAGDRVLGVGVADGTQLWSYRCTDRRALRIEFAGVPAGADPERGHVSGPEARPAVTVVCGDQTLRLDPVTGPRNR